MLVTIRVFWLAGQCGERSGHIARNLPFSSKTCIRSCPGPRSTTKSRRSALMAMLSYVLQHIRCGKAVRSDPCEGWRAIVMPTATRKCREASLAGADGHERSARSARPKGRSLNECEPDRAKQERMVCCALSGLRGLPPPPAVPFAFQRMPSAALLDGTTTPPWPRTAARTHLTPGTLISTTNWLLGPRRRRERTVARG